MHEPLEEEVSSLKLEDWWAIVQRRRRWILLPLFMCWALVWAGSWFLPTSYRSEALILVEQQKVPEQYVVPNVTVSLQDRLHSMTQQILSRTRLQTTIDRFGLYPKRRTLDTDDPVEQMRKDIDIELVESPGHPGELTAFKIDYSARSRELAQQVNSELTSLFIDENLKSQQQQSENTTAFLESQLASARAQLEQQEAKVRAFKAKHFGDLPSQLETNVQIMAGLQTQLDNNQRALDTAKQQKLYLESLLQQYQTLPPSLGGEDSSETPPEVLDKQLLDLRTKLADARSRYTEDFPDVVELKQQIEETEKLRKQVEDETTADPAPTGADNSTATTAEPSGRVRSEISTPMMQVRSQLKSNELEIKNYETHARDIEAQIATYRTRLNMTPETEQELADISRGYDESKANYNSLLQKQNQSQLATSLEQRQQGEQFRIIDPPSLPDKPASPNHFLVSCIGLIAGIALGFGLVTLAELTDHRVWREKDIEGLVPGQLLIGIPHLTTEHENRLRVATRRVEIAAAVGMTMIIVAGNLYAYYKG